MWVSEGCVAYADPALLPCLRCEMPPVAPKLLPLEDDGVVVVVMSHVGESAIAVAAVAAAAAGSVEIVRLGSICQLGVQPGRDEEAVDECADGGE